MQDLEAKCKLPPFPSIAPIGKVVRYDRRKIDDETRYLVEMIAYEASPPALQEGAFHLPDNVKAELWILDMFPHSDRILNNELWEKRYWESVGVTVHLRRPPITPVQISSSCALIGKDWLTEVRKDPSILDDDHRLRRLENVVASKERLLQNRDIMHKLGLPQRIFDHGNGEVSCNTITETEAQVMALERAESLGMSVPPEERDRARNGMASYPFLTANLDAGMFLIGKELHRAAASAAAAQLPSLEHHYFLRNTEASGHPGFHWTSPILRLTVTPRYGAAGAELGTVVAAEVSPADEERPQRPPEQRPPSDRPRPVRGPRPLSCHAGSQCRAR